jgi:hypothetical protein
MDRDDHILRYRRNISDLRDDRAEVARAAPAMMAALASLDTWIVGASYGSRNRSAFSRPIPGHVPVQQSSGPCEGSHGEACQIPPYKPIEATAGDENGVVIAAAAEGACQSRVIGRRSVECRHG